MSDHFLLSLTSCSSGREIPCQPRGPEIGSRCEPISHPSWRHAAMTTILGLDLGKFNEDLGCMVVPTDADPFQTTEQRGKSARWKGTILGTSGSLHSDFLAHNQSRSIS